MYANEANLITFCANPILIFFLSLLENIAKKCGKAGANMIDAASKIVDNFLKPVGGALGSLFKKIFKPLIIIICIIIFFVLLYLFFRYLFPIFLRKKQKKKQQKRK